ncbi:MAG: DUF2298 domain-containing protein, partial [Candidatus Promineifilaceae bacterium]
MPASDIFAAFRWWVVLMLVGVLATPLTFQILRRLPDRGYAFSKLVGLLVAGYFFWMLGSLGFLHNSAGGILAGILVLFGLSMWSYRRLNSESSGNDSVIPWIRAHWRYVLTAELVFTVMFVFWTWVRSQNPAITATEKPMEFAFLNSMGRSPDFPPLDPWLSGFSISYYYFGYVITSLITRLALVPETIGFNLANAWLPAASALGAFGLVYNLISSSRKSIHRSAIIFALVASAALPVAGNLEIVAEVLYANGVGSPELWEWLDIRDINEPINAEVAPRYESSNWWWWRSSRVIHEYDLAGNEEIGLEPIAEFPGFSFILGDLHSHVIALPFAFLSLAVALAWWRDPGEEGVDLKGLLKQRNGAALRRYFKANNGWLLLFTILIVGGLSFLNTWDVLIHMFVVVAAFMAALWLRAGGWSRVILRQGITFAVIIALGSLILYLPFYLGFRSQAGPPFLLPMIMRPTRLTHYLVIFGMSMVGVITLLAALFAGGLKYPSTRLKRGYLWRSFGITSLIIIILVALIALLGFVVASSDEGLPTVLTLADDLDQTLAVRPQDPSLPE